MSRNLSQKEGGYVRMVEEEGNGLGVEIYVGRKCVRLSLGEIDVEFFLEKTLFL